MKLEFGKTKIAIIGLGYVGLPLAVEFGKKYCTVGFDINKNRISELAMGVDSTLECSEEELSQSNFLTYSSNVDDLKSANIYIVTVPTPINEQKQPDLKPLIQASEVLGSIVSKNDIIIYESTVYPGATEEDCIPVVERVSGLEFNKDFFAGYSPERINPGDKKRRLVNILKVTSGSNPEIADFVDELYLSIITAGTYKAPSIRVAEAAKVVENTQRDVNIALVNELHHIFTKMNINTHEVIEAASTKWNFMKLFPGLVGGHCIGVDPYYLLHKAQSSGYVPDLLREAREINDAMPLFLAHDFLEKLLNKRINPIDCHVALFGFTFKENCPDIRNTKVFELYQCLKKLGFKVTVFDPWASKLEVKLEYGIELHNEISDDYDVGFLAVPHEILLSYLSNDTGKFIYDFKGCLLK